MIIHRQTRIVCTLGPSTTERPVLERLLRAGMNVARFNMAHGDYPFHEKLIATLREASRETGIPVGLLIDIKGPEIRTGPVAVGDTVTLEAGSAVTVTADGAPCTARRVSVTYRELPAQVSAGRHILIADGLIDLEVTGVDGELVRCVVRVGGELGSHKNVNVPGVRTRLPAVTDRDIDHLKFAARNDMDLVAASFVRKPEDVLEIRMVLFDLGSPMLIVAKIEDEEGLANIDAIARVADGIMVARGDLGVRLPVEQIPLAQKRIIAACRDNRKPAITATQMLDSMVSSPRPTRAEATDVANAILDGTDAVMLSGETASGHYPVEAVETMDRIARVVEASPEYGEKAEDWIRAQQPRDDVALSVARSACVVARAVRAAAIIAPSLRGNSPRLVAAFRPSMPILAVTASEQVQRQLQLVWGVVPLMADLADDSDAMLNNALRVALDAGYVEQGDRVVIVAGVPVHSPAQLNMVKVHFLGTILAKGRRGLGGWRSGRVVRVKDAEEARQRLRGDGSEVLLVRFLTPDFQPLLAGLAGIVMEESSTQEPEELARGAPGVPMIAAAHDAMRLLEDGATVTLHGEECVVYDGVVAPRVTGS